MIDQQIARYFLHLSEYLSNLLPFYATQIVNPFLKSTNHDKGKGF